MVMIFNLLFKWSYSKLIKYFSFDFFFVLKHTVAVAESYDFEMTYTRKCMTKTIEIHSFSVEFDSTSIKMNFNSFLHNRSIQRRLNWFRIATTSQQQRQKKKDDMKRCTNQVKLISWNEKVEKNYSYLLKGNERHDDGTMLSICRVKCLIKHGRGNVRGFCQSVGIAFI